MENEFVQDMLRSLAGVMDADTAKRALRALCKMFGGQLVYIPLKETGAGLERVRACLEDEAGGRDCDKILEKLVVFYGGLQVYIPLVNAAFKNDMALDIWKRYDGTRESMGELCREYGVSFSQIHRLHKKGRDILRKRREEQSQLNLFEKKPLLIQKK